jgi:hypothetical protein
MQQPPHPGKPSLSPQQQEEVAAQQHARMLLGRQVCGYEGQTGRAEMIDRM